MNAVALLELRDVVRRFGRVAALDGISLSLHPGELLGLVGPDGAGKTTAIRALMGLVRIDSGVAMVNGCDWQKAPSRAREQLGYMPQHYGLYTDLSVDENFVFFGKLFDLPKDVFEERREHLLHITRLGSARDRLAGALSGGMYKKLAIACALLHRPQALVLDEPTNGVDPVSRRELWALLYDFVSAGMGILLSTPYMDEAARCHRVALMHQGRIVLEGPPGDLVDRFEHSVLEVSATDRNAVDTILDQHPSVLAVTPAGPRIRVVVYKHAAQEIAQSLSDRGWPVATGKPDFEDLYLASVGHQSHRECA